MSSIHALQRSTTSEKLLKSVQALRPFLCESLRKNGFDPFEYINGAAELDSYLLQTPDYEDVKDIPVQGQDSGNLGSEEHAMCTYDQGEHQVHMIYDQDGGNESNAQCHGPHGDHVDKGNDGGHTHQQHFNRIGCTGHNAIVHDEAGDGLSGYVHDDYFMNDYVNSDKYIEYGHEGNTPNRSAYILESRIDMLSSLEASTRLDGMPSLTTLGFRFRDACRFPTEETLQPTLHLYSYTHLHSQHDYQELQQYYPQCQDIIYGMPSSIYNIDLNTHEPTRLSWCNNNAITNTITPVILSDAQVRKTACAKAASTLPQSQERKRRRAKSPPDTNAKRDDSFEESGALEADDGDNCRNPNPVKASGCLSSNLVCERRRRKKINEALYALRSVVPIISKMDKASIMTDALTYAKQLRKRVDDLQSDIRNLQVGKDNVGHISIDEHVQEESSSSTSNANKSMDIYEKYLQSLPKHEILELSVFNMENNMYHLRICCKKGPGDLLQLARAIEALNFDTLNSTVSSVGDQSTINTVVVKVDSNEVLKPEEVKEMILEEYGLHV